MAKRNPNYDGGGIVPSAGTDFFEGDVFDLDADKPSSPEVELFLAVVARCWLDAFECSDAALVTTDQRCEPDMVRAEARRWLTLDFGDFRRDREDICTMAGLDPDTIRAAAVKRLELAHVADAERRKIEIAAIDRAFLAMVEREADGSMTPPQVTASLRHLAIREARL